jgi:hypothetical protein
MAATSTLSLVVPFDFVKDYLRWCLAQTARMPYDGPNQGKEETSGMTTERTEVKTPPHLPFATFLSGIETLEQGLPKKLDNSAWPSQSGTAQAQLLRAFRFFDLIDEDKMVQDSLRNLVEEKDRRKELVHDLLVNHFPAIVELGKQNSTHQTLKDAMGEFGIDGDTKRKAITFFLQAADYAGLRVSPNWPAIKKRGARKGGRATGAKRVRQRRDGGASGGTVNSAKAAGSSKTITLVSGGTVTLHVSVDVMKLTAQDRAFVFEMIDKLAAYEGEGQDA